MKVFGVFMNYMADGRDLFWDRFEGRWLRGTEFHYPERPKDLPTMEPLKNWPKFDSRNARR
jgi:hypothetical protein